MRDLDICDLNGDGQKEILAATSGGLVVALDSKCRKVWARRLGSAPTIMKCVRPKPDAGPLVFVGCENGKIVVLDGQGEMIRSGRVTGRPMYIESLTAGKSGSLVLLATNNGEVKAFKGDSP
jgi:hypothetical protein